MYHGKYQALHSITCYKAQDVEYFSYFKDTNEYDAFQEQRVLCMRVQVVFWG